MGRFFDPNDEEIREVYDEEAFIADVQHGIHRLLEAKGVSRAELARRIGVSAAHVTQMLSNKPKNLTLRTIARVYSALDEEACLQPRSVHDRRQEVEETWEAVTAASREYWFCAEPEPEPEPAVAPAPRRAAPLHNSAWAERYLMKEAA